ncbi:MAG: coenzyme F420 biosynthesis-associated protein [Burkholderiaceae bacterium]|nr:MAG: coenzyme F420 biosynthesis-associated protein [Burkholderiaceae bacterium]
MAEPVDWALALATGVRTAGKGPELSLTEAAAEVEALRSAARAAQAPVASVTGLTAADDVPAVVVDRPEWIRSNASSLRVLLEPVAATYSGGFAHGVTSRIAAVELGLALGWMSGKVLGQFEALPGLTGEPRLLLVAPNIVAAAEAMGADAADFRLWVCLHEETHRVQFGAVGWLPDFFADSVATLLADLNAGPGELVSRVASGVRSNDGLGLAGLLQAPASRATMLQLLALMTLLEGHADWVMDSAGDVVPSAPQLRSRFEQRRSSAGLLDTLIRKVLGVDAKMAQYRDGAAFVRAVVGRVGRDEFNRVWQSPDTLPTMDEIRSPDDWVTRVCR